MAFTSMHHRAPIGVQRVDRLLMVVKKWMTGDTGVTMPKAKTTQGLSFRADITISNISKVRVRHHNQEQQRQPSAVRDSDRSR